MQKTTRYQLNQWAPEDRILCTDFNRDNENLESALSGLDAAVEAERSARQAAVTGAKAEAAGAVAAANLRMDGFPIKRLADIVTTADAAQVDIDVSAWPLADYVQLIIVPMLSVSFTGSSQTVRLLCNGLAVTDGYRVNSYKSDYLLGLFFNSVGGTHAVLRLLQNNSNIFLIGESINFSTGYSILDDHDFCGVLPTVVTADQLQTLNFVPSSSEATIKAGSRFLICGVN